MRHTLAFCFLRTDGGGEQLFRVVVSFVVVHFFVYAATAFAVRRSSVHSFVRSFVCSSVHCSLFTVHCSLFVLRSFVRLFVRSFVRSCVRAFVRSVGRTYVGRRVKQKLLLCGPRLQLRCKSAARFCASAVRCSALSSTSSSSSLSLLLLFLPPPHPPPSSLLLLLRDVAALRRFCACNVVARGPTNRSQSTAARNRLRPHASNCFELWLRTNA